ncbi:MAG: hypothetical protein EOM64_09760 [Erysipelotrichia bacterium]|nr:hypothetical protein [Erysipelotrichia bacterium]
MMREYGIVDIGSNTIVLNVYEMKDGIPNQVFHVSKPVHLIDSVQNGSISDDGIQKACLALRIFDSELDKRRTPFRYAFVTEPARNISNQKEFLKALSCTGFIVEPLSGHQEAEYDFYGSRLTYPDIMQGTAFDVGGGSTELISFHDGDIIDAISIPLGCVRLSHLPLDTPDCRNALIKAKISFRSLNRCWPTLIGIGGTCRAAGLLTDELFHSGSFMKTDDLKQLYEKLKNQDITVIRAMNKLVDPARHGLLLPGIHMILEIADQFQASMIRISATGVREGYLLSHIDLLDR